MRVRDLILVIYGVAIVAILADIAIQAKRNTATFYDDTVVSQAWTVGI